MDSGYSTYLNLFSFILSTVASASAWGASHAPKMEVAEVSVQGRPRLLGLTLQDSNPVTGVCRLHVQRFEYLPSVETLVLEMDSKQPCLNEAIGKRKGTFLWVLPESVKSKSVLRLIVNQRSIGNLELEGDQARIQN